LMAHTNFHGSSVCAVVWAFNFVAHVTLFSGKSDLIEGEGEKGTNLLPLSSIPTPSQCCLVSALLHVGIGDGTS
jgi:hypothetical protein